MSDAVLDHLVVAASRLDDGIRHVAEALGVEPVPGGRHPDMGTHNALLRLGPGTYLEVIAVDPEAPAPGEPRWFDLDGADTRAALAQGPRLLTWVARSDELEALAARRPWDTGAIRRMRRGDLAWRIAFPSDGRLVEGGLLPPLIEWDPGTDHPATRLPDTGCSLIRLRAFHPRAKRVHEVLAQAGLGDALEIEPVSAGGGIHLQAIIEMPDGLRTLV